MRSKLLNAIGLASVIVLSARASHADVVPGDVITRTNVEKAADFLHPGLEWCVEHGIPEDECSMCLPARTVKAEFKDKGDWCDDHNRAKSQCFICDPSLKEKFAAKYRAKFGTEPPPITEE